MRLSSITESRLAACACLLVPLCMAAATANDPLLGDSVSTVSRAALHIYDHNLSALSYPPESDPGHPAFLPYLLAGLWRLTGLSLPAAHFFTAFWGVLALWGVRRLSLSLPTARARLTALGLAAVSPLALSQMALVNTHLPLAAFFVWANAARLEKKWFSFALWGGAMMASHLEAPFLWLSLLAADAFLAIGVQKTPFRQWATLRRGAAYAFPVIVLALWGGWHASQTGWAFHSPHYAEHREATGGLRFLLNLPLCLWRITDYGHFALFLPVFYVLWKKCPALSEHPLWAFAAAQTMALAVLLAYFSGNSIAHRYFLPVLPLWFVVSAQALESVPRRGQAITVAFVFLCLAFGNFFYYPGKTLSDANLLYRNWFALEKQIQTDLPQHTLYTYAPLSHEARTRFLKENQGLRVARLYETPLEQWANNIPAILESNLNGEFTPEQKKFLNENWPQNSYQNGAVYATVYFNPKFYPAKNPNWRKREPTGAEKLMEKLKEMRKFR